MEEVVGNLVGLVCVVLVSFGGFGVALAYILWEKQKKQKVAQGRQSIGKSMGFETISAPGEPLRLGTTHENGLVWEMGWEVRKIAGSSPRFATFMQCQGQSWPKVELRLNPTGQVQLSGMCGDSLPTGHEGLDARFLAAGEVAALEALGDVLLTLADLAQDVILFENKLVMVCEGKHEDPTFLHQRLEAMDKIARAL